MWANTSVRALEQGGIVLPRRVRRGGTLAVRTRTHPRADAGPVFGPAGGRQSHVYMDAEHVLRPQDTRKEGSYARSMDLSLPEIRSDGGSRHSRPRATVASRPGTNGSQGRG